MGKIGEFGVIFPITVCQFVGRTVSLWFRDAFFTFPHFTPGSKSSQDQFYCLNYYGNVIDSI